MILYKALKSQQPYAQTMQKAAMIALSFLLQLSVCASLALLRQWLLA